MDTRFVPRAARACALFLAAAALLHGAAEQNGICAEAGKIARDLAAITGLSLLREPPCAVIGRQQVNEFLKARMKESADPKGIRAEEITLKKFGFAPPDFHLESAMVDLMTEQAAAFYDYRSRKLFVMEGASEAMQEPTLAHELAHALADQHFRLAKFIGSDLKDDDRAAAHVAVMEGQAVWIAAEYVARKFGMSLRNNPELAARMGAISAVSGQFPVFDNAPLYFRLSLLFPYSKGAVFQNALLERDGQSGFSEAFLRPPVSTQQITHPDKYFEGVAPTSPGLPAVKLPGGYKRLSSGVLGEFDHSVLLQQFGDEGAAAEIAPHWRGSAYELRENRKTGSVVLLYSVEWDDPEIARKYFEFYKGVLGKKWRNFAPISESAGRCSGSGDDGRFELRLEGRVFTSVEGLPAELN